MQNKTIAIAVLAAFLMAGTALAAAEYSEPSDAASGDYVKYYSYSLNFTFTGSGADPENVVWNFGDGSATETGYKVSHTYSLKGDYIVSQTATNEKGSDTKLFYITIMGDPTVTFDTVGGSDIASVTVPYVKGTAQKVDLPADPTKAGFTFMGWYKDSAYTTQWDFGEDVVTKDTTLYAKWFNGILVNGMPSTEDINKVLDEVDTLNYYIPASSTGNMTLNKDLFPLDANKKLTVHIYNGTIDSMKDLVVWTFDGNSTYNDKCADTINLRVDTQYGAFNPDEQSAAEGIGAKSGYYLHFDHSGELPYSMFVTVYVGDHYSNGSALSLYYYSNGTMSAEHQEPTVNADGYVVVTLSHCSDYALLSFHDVASSGIDTNTMIIIGLVLVILVIAAVAYNRYKNKKTD